MFEGSDELDISSARDLSRRAASTADALHLVRNPNYDPSTDTPKMRENLPDEFQFTSTRTDDIFNKIEAGDTTSSDVELTAAVLRKYAHGRASKQYFQSELWRPHVVPDHEPDAAAVRRP